MDFIKETMTTEHGKIPFRKGRYSTDDPLDRRPDPVVASLKAVVMENGRIQ
jgi:hypothetical protein